MYDYIITTNNHTNERVLTIFDETGDIKVITRDDKVVDVFESIIDGADADQALKNLVSNYRDESHKFTVVSDAMENVGMGEILEIIAGHNASKAVEAFLDKVSAIEDIVVRENLKAWISANPSVRITDEGNVVGYRGLDDNLRSIHAGYGIVNGVPVNGQHDCSPGNTIEIPRVMVDHNAGRSCSFGLHIGTYDYARSWGSRVVLVEFDPADAVAIAYEKCKLRVCKYRVIKEIS